MPLSLYLLHMGSPQNGEIKGEVLAEANVDPGPLLPRYADEEYPLLSYISPWGWTFFSRDQMKPFLLEWEKRRTVVQTDDLATTHKAVEEIALQCQRTVDGFLCFVGD